MSDGVSRQRVERDLVYGEGNRTAAGLDYS